jgi:peroxiredoxin
MIYATVGCGSVAIDRCMLPHMNRRSFYIAILLSTVLAVSAVAQQKPARVWSPAAQPIMEGIRKLRALPDADRGAATKNLALRIRELPAGKDKFDLALGLASRATEGDFGTDNLQAVTTTLEGVLQEAPPAPEKNGDPAYAYTELASLVRYEHMKASLDEPQYVEAMTRLAAQDQRIQSADFTLQDTKGKSWNLKSLKGKVVLVNFWATWCPPCRKEMPDLEALSTQFEKQGLVVLGLTDEDAATVNKFLSTQPYKYPILFDSNREAAKQFGIEGIPKSYIYDRDGKLVAQSIDMRTREQFKAMLAEAGLK